MAILGERWTFVVLREVFNGVRRFDDIRRHSGIPRQVLSNRLALLVEQGVLRREPYQDPGERARHEYRLTEKGFDLYPVLVAIADWGDRYLADPEGPPVAFTHRDCGAPVHAELHCADGHLVDRPRDVAPRPGRRRPRASSPAGGYPVGSRRPLAEAVDPGVELLGVRDRGGGSAELLAQGGVGDAVGLAGAVVPGGDEAVELAAQDRQLLVGGDLALERAPRPPSYDANAGGGGAARAPGRARAAPGCRGSPSPPPTRRDTSPAWPNSPPS